MLKKLEKMFKKMNLKIFQIKHQIVRKKLNQNNFITYFIENNFDYKSLIIEPL